MLDLKEKLIVALDVDSLDKAKHFVDLLYPAVKFFKVGSQLFTAAGPAAIKMIGDKGAKVFLDLKFYDIPNTVYSAVASGTSSTIVIHPIPTGLAEIKADNQVKKSISAPVFMMTVHIEGGEEMLRKAANGAKEKANELGIKKPYIVGITVLTSKPVAPEMVLERAKLAKDSGLDGVVCSAHEVQKIRSELGKDFIIVTPGIRPKGYKPDDQSRVDTAQAAIEAGANFIVIGRPILEAEDPLKVAKEILGSQ